MDSKTSHTPKKWVALDCDENLRDIFVKELDIHPLTSRLLIQRGVETLEDARAFLHPKLQHMHDPYIMKDMHKAVHLVLTSLEQGAQIVVHGDYDVDGISSTSVLYEFLSDIGANVSYFIPRRNIEGYGLVIETVRRLQHEGADLLITTDCGISNVDEITLARALGLNVIVVDHHTVPKILPPANAILNPLQEDCDFPFKKLAAVGVAFNFVVALRSALRERGIFNYVDEPDLRNYLDLVALGTIADVVPLVDENRLFAKFGLAILSKRKRAGISALIERACSNVKEVTTQTVGFQIAPRLNAAGRMGDASICVELLTTRSYARAVELAGDLERMNKQRQLSEREIWLEALPQAEKQVELEWPILVIAGHDWNRGVLGIVASRMMERFHRPAILLGIEDGVGKGSARSLNGISLIEAMGKLGHLLRNFGGHNSAAGLALSEEHLDEFRSSMPIIVSEMLNHQGPARPSIQIDGEVEFRDLDDTFLDELAQLSPFGMGNPEPIFVCPYARSSRVRIVGKRHLRARFHDDEQLCVDGIGFSMVHAKDLLYKPVAVAFVPKCSTKDNVPRLEMHIKDLRPTHNTCSDHIESMGPVSLQKDSSLINAS